MSLENSLSTCVSENRKYDSYFFMQFENKIQVVFDEICKMKNSPLFQIKIVKGSMYLNGDYFIPLQSNEKLNLICKELLQKIKEISNVLSVEVDATYNLVFAVKRPVVYKDVLLQVVKKSRNYGMFEKNKVALVLIDSYKSNDCARLRTHFLVDHLISILSANKIKVYSHEFDPDNKIMFESPNRLVCSEECCQTNLQKKLTACIKSSKWSIISDEDDTLIFSAKRFIEFKSLESKYGKVFKSNIELTPADLERINSIQHLLKDHMKEFPDYVIHVALQGQNKIAYKSGLLLEMLENLRFVQVYIFSQSVHNKDSIGTTINDYLSTYRSEIENAMQHKYKSFNPDEDCWSLRIQALFNTALKVDLLRISHSSVLNLRLPSSRDGERNFGVFIQYNFARLANIFRIFEAKVEEGYYHSLLPLEEVDLGHLQLEEEWNLFHHVISFPVLVRNVLDSLTTQEKPQCKLNKVCLMLMELSQCLSLYYSKIRILSEPLPYLQKIMNARLWLLKGLYQVYKNSFTLLNLEGLDQM